MRRRLRISVLFSYEEVLRVAPLSSSTNVANTYVSGEYLRQCDVRADVVRRHGQRRHDAALSKRPLLQLRVYLAGHR